MQLEHFNPTQLEEDGRSLAVTLNRYSGNFVFSQSCIKQFGLKKGGKLMLSRDRQTGNWFFYLSKAKDALILTKFGTSNRLTVKCKDICKEIIHRIAKDDDDYRITIEVADQPVKFDGLKLYQFLLSKKEILQEKEAIKEKEILQEEENTEEPTTKMAEEQVVPPLVEPTTIEAPAVETPTVEESPKEEAQKGGSASQQMVSEETDSDEITRDETSTEESFTKQAESSELNESPGSIEWLIRTGEKPLVYADWAIPNPLSQ